MRGHRLRSAPGAGRRQPHAGGPPARVALAGASYASVPAAGAKGRKRTVFFVDEAAASNVPPVLFVILFVQTRWGSEALVATSALVGLTDLDALTLSLARSAASSGDVSPAALALAAGILSNTLLKLTVAVVVGRGSFRTATAAMLGAMALAMAVTLVVR